MTDGAAEPIFAVVGHPNKGKSALVATLAQDERVLIAPEAGTTQRCERFPLVLGGQRLYTLVDTPGFQRPRAVLAWLREQERDASQRPAIVKRFTEIREHRAAYPDEVELLSPIVAGAAIIYVVDGSVPYGPAYEPEMEILRWSGRPRMAVINPIGGAAYQAQWRDALGQYFSVVRVIDALRAPFEQRLELLEAFGSLREDWAPPIARAVTALRADRHASRQRAAAEIAAMLAAMLAHEETRRLGAEITVADEAAARQRLEEQYRGSLRRYERRCREAVEACYRHHRLDRRESDFEPLLEEDLFAERTWNIFGLRQRDLIAAGVVSGAATGFGLDIATGGTSLFTGAAIGSVVGGAAAWLLPHARLGTRQIKLPLGGRELRCGPSRNANLPFVVLGRARLHQMLVAGRTHAERTALAVAHDQASQQAPDTTTGLPPIGAAERRTLAELFGRLNPDRFDSAARREAEAKLTETIASLLPQ